MVAPAMFVALASLVATSAVWPVAEAAKQQKPLDYKPIMVNQTVTAEATLEFTIKNFDESGDLHGTLKVGLFGEAVPMTVFNFLSICKGTKRPTGELKFSGSYCHRLIPDMHFQCGDITKGNGDGGTSIFGDKFNDENFEIGHSEKGTISMSNRGRDTNGSQFFITAREMRNLDGRHVAFGQIMDKASLDFLAKMNEVPTDKDYKPLRTIKLVDCTANNLKKPYILKRKGNAKQDTFDY
nr:venom-related protein peptidyl-prolyl isomerase [Conus ebraeus]